MAIENEVGLRVADHLGINRQILDEDLQDQYYISTGNLYERKIGELQPRGGSALQTNVSVPSNISSFGKPFAHYDRILGKTDMVNVKCSPQTPPITLSNISVAFVTDALIGGWGAAVPLVKTSDSSTVTGHAFVGADNGGIRLIATGFGLNSRHSVDFTSGLPAMGDTKKLQVTIASGGLGNSNITGIDVYASVTYSFTSGSPFSQWMYVGHINVIANPTGTFTFHTGPVTLYTDTGFQVNAIGGPAADAVYSFTGLANGGGTLTAGKTYWCGLMSQHIYYDYANPVNSRTYWSCYSVQSVTLGVGQNAVAVSKTAGGSAATLPFFGTHPQLLQPYGQIVSNSATFSDIFNSVNNPGTFSANQMGCAKFTPNTTVINTGQWSYYTADFAIDEMFARLDLSPWSNTGNWEAIPICNFNWLNGDNFNNAGSNSAQRNNFNVGNGQYLGVASNAFWRGDQYNSQGQDLLYLIPSTGWNSNYSSNPVVGFVGTTVAYTGSNLSAASNITNMSSTKGLSVGMMVIGPMFGFGCYISAISGTTVTVGSVYTDIDSSASGATQSLTNTPITFLPQAQSALPLVSSLHNLVHCDGNVGAMVEIDFSHQPPPYAALMKVYTEQLVIAGGPAAASNRCYFAQIQSPYAWGVPGNEGVSQYFQAESGGEPVTGLSVYTNSMYYTGPLAQFMVTKLNTVFVFTAIPVYTGTSFNNATMIQLAKKSGCANHDTIVQTEMGTIYASIDNVWLARDSGEPIPIGNEIGYLLRPEDPSILIDTTYWSAVYHDNKYKLSFSVGGASVPSQEVWLDLRKMKLQKGQPAWFGPMSGREVRFQCVEERFNDTIIPKRICVDATNGFWYQADREDVRQDFGADLTYTLTPHIFYFKNPAGNKLHKRQVWGMKVDSQFTFTEVLTYLSTTLGAVADSNTRTVSPIPGYTSSNYANFVNSCRVKLYPFYPVARLRGENCLLSWTYTGHALFTIASFTLFTADERRRVD